MGAEQNDRFELLRRGESKQQVSIQYCLFKYLVMGKERYQSGIFTIELDPNPIRSGT
ncbi:hypothetical protein [Acaryochloris marina]|uniref:hypothetical protein n=1 Tax=Acaryochloris marina TaxID=155978 RepID=UPI001BAFDF30|nr:hypothetical protein [Acaryochloris marina]QUY44398.1 hypothetical protein I1H34_10065 [Acaryochloris marina S15]